MRGEEGLFRLSVRNPPLCRFSERIFPPNTFFSATFDSFFFLLRIFRNRGRAPSERKRKGFRSKDERRGSGGEGDVSWETQFVKIGLRGAGGEGGWKNSLFSQRAREKKRGQGRVRPRPLRSLYSA